MPSLRFSLENQKRTEWCWLAVAVGIARYWERHVRKIGHVPSQCELASRFIPGPRGRKLQCCGRGERDLCDKPGHIEKVLNGLGIRVHPRAPGAMSFREIQVTIAVGLPVIARIGWPDGSGHIVVIYGWKEINGYRILEVKDPLYPDSWVEYNHFVSHYRIKGKWTDTIRLRLGGTS